MAHFWSIFSAAPPKHRNLMLRGILAQCCFPQLSYISSHINDLVKIDFLTALPLEISYKILAYLDTSSLCKAAQVSHRWKYLADDDVVWHRMCEQHIDRKCKKCGWGLPLLDRKRIRDSKLQIRQRAIRPPSPPWQQQDQMQQPLQAQVQQPSPISEGNASPAHARRADDGYYVAKYRPWKEVYKDRFRVGINWKYGRCTTKIFRGHTNGVMCLQFEDNILATGSYDATIKIWDINTGEEIRTLRGHSCGIRCLQFDDTKLISGSLDHRIKIWNWRTGECISTYAGHSGGVLSVHFDSTILVSGSMDNTVRIWNFKDKSARSLRGHTDWVNCVKVDTLSRTVFTASDDLTARLWDLDTGRPIQTFWAHAGQVQQVLPLPREFEMDPEDKEECDDRSQVDDLDETMSNQSESAPEEQAHYPTCSYKSIFTGNRPHPPRYMITAALDSTIRLWEVPTGRCLRTFFGHIEGVWAVAADMLRLVSGSQDHSTKVWDLRTGDCERTFTGHVGPVSCIALSDSRMATGSEDSEVRMYCYRT